MVVLRKIILFLVPLLLGFCAWAQIPANDSCQNALEIPLSNVGFGTGTYQSDSINIDSATVQTGEFFHTSLVTSGNDKKSIWFKFYLPSRRGINIELKQNANNIAILDCGFTTYLSDSCLPSSLAATAAKITTLNQFGSSFHPCMEPGWYMVQVSAKTRALGKVYLEITSTYPYEHTVVTNALYDATDSAYDFGSQLVGKHGYQYASMNFDLGCYSISDTLEYFKDIGTDYKEFTQSAWFVFQSNDDADNTLFKFTSTSCGADTFGYRLYKGNVKTGSALQLVDSTVYNFAADYCYSSCYYGVAINNKCQFDSGEFYSIQLLFHKDNTKTITFRIDDNTSQYDQYKNAPIASKVTDLGTITGNSSWPYFGFSCHSYMQNNTCGNTNDSIVQIGSSKFNLSQWFTFELANQSQLTLRPRNINYNNNSKNYSSIGVRLFADTATTSCTDVDTASLLLSFVGTQTTINCLPAGKYLVQLLGTDTTSFSCNTTLHLGGDYQLALTQTNLAEKNRFSAFDTLAFDTVNGGNSLLNFATVIAGRDTISCFEGPQPEEVCDTNLRKVMYRTFTIGDADNDGNADSGLLYIDNLRTIYHNYNYYNHHRLYKGNAGTLSKSQNVSAYPDTLKGLTPYSSCFPTNATYGSVCLEPGEYTLVSFFDDLGINNYEEPRLYFHTVNTHFDTYNDAEFVDSMTTFGSYYGQWDTFSCANNPDTIDGVYCGPKNTYHVFYVDTPSVATVSPDFYSRAYRGRRASLFKGDIRNGKGGLSLFDDGTNWSCFGSKTTTACDPLTPGWYTVMISVNIDETYDSVFRAGTNGYYLYRQPHRVEVTLAPTNITPPKYYRPSLAADVDSLINNKMALAWDTNYCDTAGMKQNLKRYNFPIEELECDLDTPLNHFPTNQLCLNNTTNIVYYTFTLDKNSYVRIYGNTSGGTWKVRMYDFDVRTDSAKLDTTSPIQNCNYTANHVEFCNLKAGRYSLVYFCSRNNGNVYAKVEPIVHIDSVHTSRFDHASLAYDFGAIPGDNTFYDGKVGDVHPGNSVLPASHDVITCKTGSQYSDPTNATCYVHYNPYVYSQDTNNAFYPLNAYYYSRPGGNYYPWNTGIRRNLWYSFVVNGRGNVTVDVNGVNSSFINHGNALRFAIYESDADGSLSLDSLRAIGEIDSTLTDGLSLVASIQNYCYYTYDLTRTFTINSCDEAKPKRYYVLVEVASYYHNAAVPNINQNVWLDIKYDSLELTNSKYDFYSNANLINGRNSINLLLNCDFENSNQGWGVTNGSWYIRTTLGSLTPASGTYYTRAYHNYTTTNTTMEIYQKVKILPYQYYVNNGTATLNLSGYIQSEAESPPDSGRIIVEYLNSNGTVISLDSSAWITSVGSWALGNISKTIPVGTEALNVKLQAQKPSSDYYHHVYFDNMSLTIGTPNDTAYAMLDDSTVYTGNCDFFVNASTDTTDVGRVSTNYNCNNPAYAKTVWYQFNVDETGVLYYNYKHSRTSGGVVTEHSSYSPDNLRLYRSDIPGDSIFGLNYIPRDGTTGKFSSLMGGYQSYVCVYPGTYYLQINKCSSHDCHDYVCPNIMFEYHNGDYCETALPIQLDTLESNSNRGIVNCMTIGTDFGEDGSNMGCLFGPSGYKSIWFVVDYTDTAKVDLEFQLGEYTTASPSEIRYRTFYGSCDNLTPAPCNNNALTSFVIDCVRQGTYYVQVVVPDDATGEVELTVEAIENLDTTCVPFDPEVPTATFYHNNSCPENVIEFVNTSTQGDSVVYLWDFGYNSQTSTEMHPYFSYPVQLVEDTFTVKLIVHNQSTDKKDSLSIEVIVPASLQVEIANNDTMVCLGESVTLSGSVSRGQGIWSTGDTTNSITVNKTGTYFYQLADKPNILVNGNFEQALTTGWTIQQGNWTYSTDRNYLYDSSRTMYSTYSSSSATGQSIIYQDVDVSFDSLEIDSGIAKIAFEAFFKGHTTYTDFAQLSVEYYNASTSLIGVYRTGYITDDEFYQVLHSRTVPVGTRRVRIVVEVDKQNTSSSTAFIFFDKMSLKMRSACDYKDSVYVQVNPHPIVSLPTDTSFCYGDSMELIPTVMFDNPYVAIDSMNYGYNGSLKGAARYNFVGGYVQLAGDYYYGDNGQIEWEDSSLLITDSFTYTYQYHSEGSGYYANYFYLFNQTTPTSHNSSTGGYTIALEFNYNRIELEWNNARLANITLPFDIDNREWHDVTVNYNNKTFIFYLDGDSIGTYTDATARTQVGYKFGIGASQYYNNPIKVKNFHLSRNNPYYVAIPSSTSSVINDQWSDLYSGRTRWVSMPSTLIYSADVHGCQGNADTIIIDVDTSAKDAIQPLSIVCENTDSFRVSTEKSLGKFIATSYLDTLGWFNVQTAGAGTHPIVYEITSSSACYFRDSTTVEISGVIPDDTIQHTFFNACQDSVGFFVNKTTPGNFTYQWRFDNAYPNDSNGSNLTNVGMVQFLDNGTQFAYLTVTNDTTNCVFMDSLPVLVNCSYLPVELVVFDVQKVSNEWSKLNWVTAYEENASHFEVYRRAQTEPEFVKIGEVAAAGYSNALKEYRLRDNISKVPNGLIFYQLKQVDFNGKYSHSKLKFIDKTSLLKAGFEVFPVPTSGLLKVKNSVAGRLSYQIYSALGTLVAAKEVDNANGLAQIDVSQLLNGYYFIVLPETGDRAIFIVE